MERMLHRTREFALFGLVCAVALAALAAFAPAFGAEADRTVILISLDGTTPADVVAAKLPTLESLARNGASATRLVPVFPANTFPNHVSLVTGVVPAVHGIVNNEFIDPRRGLFRYSNDPTWIEVEPLWAIAARQGVVCAAYHWIGSEGPWRNGFGPRYWKAFDSRTSESVKVDQILAWLDIENPDDRPRLITSWFPGADRAGHRFGPGSPEAHAALRRQDEALARLLRGLTARGTLETGILLVVSDHGMVPVERSVDLDRALRGSGSEAEVLGGGGIATLSVSGGERELAKVLALVRSLGLDPRIPGAAARDLPLGNPRFGDVVVLAPVGTAISSRPGPPMRGSHGYLPAEPGMGALLFAAGRGVRAGSRLGEVRTLDVAPTVLARLGIAAPAWMEGRPIAGLVGGEAAAEAERSIAPGMGVEP